MARQNHLPWTAAATTSTDCTFHQIAPYIGRLKTTIAQFLIDEYTNVGDLVVDPFCGSGVVPLEAYRKGRRVFASDRNPYAILLTKAKLCGPSALAEALTTLRRIEKAATERIAAQDLRSVPGWVRNFFHPRTLRETLAFRDACLERRDYFTLACLLGILHHQRPGFLSYPASHLVPYLRSELFPRQTHADLYEYRAVLPRLEAKIRRTFKRPPCQQRRTPTVVRSDAKHVRLPSKIDAVITSPPYMNSLDYVRDNRLRIWFLNKKLPNIIEIERRNRVRSFQMLMHNTLDNLIPQLKVHGKIILVLGDVNRSGAAIHPAEVVQNIIEHNENLRCLRLSAAYTDQIPDLRRSRRDCSGTKEERIIVLEKSLNLTKNSGAR